MVWGLAASTGLVLIAFLAVAGLVGSVLGGGASGLVAAAGSGGTGVSGIWAPSSGAVLGSGGGVAIADIPQGMLAIYEAAAPSCPGLPWQILAGIGKVETNHARAVAISSAGAEGPMQFLPSTWAQYGVEADGDGVADINSPIDSVFGAAKLLCANGAGQPATLPSAIWDYNHSQAYVAEVLSWARAYGWVR
jgi:hypothetical protein